MSAWQDILDKVNKMWCNKEVFSNCEFQMLVNILNERAYEVRNIGSEALKNSGACEIRGFGHSEVEEE